MEFSFRKPNDLAKVYQSNPPVATIVLALFLLGIYGTQLLLTAGTGPTAAYEIPQNLHDRFGLWAIIITPWLHSSHGYVTTNIIFLLIFGCISEPLVGTHKQIYRFIGIVYTVGFTVAVGTGSITIGISGLVYALAGVVLVLSLELLLTSESRVRGIFAGLTLLASALFIGKGMAPLIGLIELPPGTSLRAHVLGVLVGVTLEVSRIVRTTK